jgi:hopanoid-associated phosphorylase
MARRSGEGGTVVGAVCGLRAEAHIAEAAGWRAACAGGDPQATRDAAERLVAEGARLLLSFGIAGGLDPALAAGAVILADRVVGARRAVAPPLAIDSIPGLRAAAILAADEAVASVSRKAELFRVTGAVAVDLESGIVAEVATAAGLPYLALRAIADPAGRELPAAARLPLRRDGRPDLAAVLLSVARDPRQIPGLIRVARDTSAALAGLRKAIPLLQARLGPS